MDTAITFPETPKQTRQDKSRSETKNERYPHLRKRNIRTAAINGYNSNSKLSSNDDCIETPGPSDIPGAYQCGLCSQKFHTMELLSDHSTDHCKDDVFQCNMCNDVFKKAETLSAHLDGHTNVVKAFKCGICNAGFLENAALTSHLKQKHEVLPFLYKCNICLLLFKEVSKLISHAAKKHPPICKEYKCGICDKKFTQGARLTLHVQKHADEKFQQSNSYVSKAQVQGTKLKIHLKSHAKGNSVIKTERRSTRSSRLQWQSPKKNKNKNKETTSKSEKRKENIFVGNDEDGNYDIIEEDELFKSTIEGKNNTTEKLCHVEEKKAAIRNNDELILTYKRIDPETQSEVYDCDVCGERFVDCSALTQHRAAHLIDDKFCINCHHCHQVYDSFEDLNEHITSGKCNGYVCLICGKSFSLEPFLLIHEAKDHWCDRKVGNKLICRTCEKTFDNRTAFLRHASSHSEIKCIQCKLCRHSFTTPETLFGHLRSTHSLIPLSRKKYEYSCKTCEINFMKLEALHKHQSIVHKIKTEEHSMKVINKPKKPKQKKKNSSESPIRRTGHWRSAEDDKLRRTCPICNRVFRRYKDVRRHIGTHTKPHLCSHCGKAFPYRYTLDAHIKAFHTAENPFKCEECSKYFSCPRSLIVHQRIHTGERPHQCDICQKRFRQVANLSMHLKLHNADKPIKCPLCDYCCRHRGYLKRHMSTHSKEKKHFCPLCNKGFTEKPNLNHHLKRHTKIKNHVCAVCGHRFAERYYLNNHMRIHTKEKPYVCPVCNRAFTMRPNMVSHIKKTHPSYNYQPVRPSHRTVIANNIDGSLSVSMLETSLPPTSQTVVINTTLESIPAPIIPPSLPPTLTQQPTDIPMTQVYHSSETPSLKIDNQPYPARDPIVQASILKNQLQQPVDPTVMRSQVVLREPMLEQNLHHEDAERRNFVNVQSARLPVEPAAFDAQRDVSNHNFSVVLPSHDYLYSYPNLTSDPFMQGFFPLTNQQSQHPQQKP